HIVSFSYFSHRKIPSIIDRLVGLLFSVYYEGIISFKEGLFVLASPENQANLPGILSIQKYLLHH
ncbi:hypothetical protein UY416_20210, partial [Paenibacillus polymyxa]|nr:hypothetical protein [Paenibacillus polymyxa]